MENLEVEIVYFYPLENGKQHHTDKYEMVHDEEIVIPVLRRGQKFTLAIRFSGRNYSEGTDNVSLIFNFGSTPNSIKSTKGIVRLKTDKTFKPDGKRWMGSVITTYPDSIIVEVCSPVDCPVGLWNMQVETTTKNFQSEPSVYEWENGIYFLFNPWQKDDLVYMDDERLLDEYILSDVGKIWIGPMGSSKGREWVFGQFDACVLPASIMMLDMSKIPFHSRGDPIKMVRIISKMVNNNDDDNGVVVGRWDGDYIDGTAPAAWTGSVDILRQYLETQQSVSYGQCWVFAGVTTTKFMTRDLTAIMVQLDIEGSNRAIVIASAYFAGDGITPPPSEVRELVRYCSSKNLPLLVGCDANTQHVMRRSTDINEILCRALGIPSRVVSNLVSAHDANSTLTIDKYYNEQNEEIEFDPHNEKGIDSIWNYHVWSDVWMARPDLPPGYGGWQAIDATPQEPSSGVFQCGPASLEAIKKGAVGFNYDVGFMVASVNADLLRWKIDPSTELGYSKIYCNKYHIGRMILTKKPWIFDPNGDQDKENITLQYKSMEGSPEERLSLYNAIRNSELAKRFYNLPDKELEDIEFDLLEIERIKIGESFNVTVIAKNKCVNLRSIKISLSAKSVFYNGVTAHQIDKTDGSFQLKPQTSDKLELVITADKYMNKLVEYCNIKLHAVATVEETMQTWADEDDFQVMKPTININIPDEIPTRKPTKIILRFSNPLKETLTNCKFTVSGPSLLRSQIVGHHNVKPRGSLKIECEIIPRFPGEQKIIAVFDSKELRDVTGSAQVYVIEEE